MELPFVATAKCEVRAVIRFLNAKEVKPIEIHREFAAGRIEVHDEERSGRPSISNGTVTKLEQTMREDRRITLDDLCILVPEVSRSTIHRILAEKLQYRKIVELYKEKRKIYRAAILKAKKEEWRKLIKSIEDDVWGTPYKILRGKRCKSAGGLSRDEALSQVKKLFPSDPDAGELPEEG
ncbi:hypothetical protein ANTQUA_LOCUS9046 [Anthophora quadrimaculata]